jgi:RNA polymerase sigma factor (sigma-70 family)
VQQVLNGREIAFSEIQLRYELYVFLFILSRVDDKEEAENLTQDTFVKALVSLRAKRYKAEGHFSAWLLGIAENAVNDYHKHKINEPHALLSEEMEEVLPAPAITYSDPHLQKLLGKALEKLNAEDCTILIMHAVEEKTYKEIGEILHMKKDAVKRRFLRLCEKLRKVLGGVKNG